MDAHAHGTDDTSGEIAIVLTTEESPTRANELASQLIDAGAAACVTLHEIRSVYRWEGSIVDATEVQLVIKTTPAGAAAVRATIAEHHGYDLPEVIVLEAAASDRYARWVADEVGWVRSRGSRPAG